MEANEVLIFHQSRAEIGKQIGSGSFGAVYKGRIRDSRLPDVALKIFYPEIKNTTTLQKDRAFDELNKMALLEHENVVKLLGMVDDEIPWLVFEYLRDGNLLEYVNRKTTIKEKRLVRYCRDICSGMAFLHQHNIIHKDLAARNILLLGKTAKVADLGLSSFLHYEQHAIYSLGGKVFPYRHAAYECIVEEIFAFESDVWAFAILMWEIWSGGKTPYGKINHQAEVRKFIADRITPLDLETPDCSEHILDIMQSILYLQDRTLRPSFVQLRHWFEAIMNGYRITIPTPSRIVQPEYPQQDYGILLEQQHNELHYVLDEQEENQIYSKSKRESNLLEMSSRSSLSTPNLALPISNAYEKTARLDVPGVGRRNSNKGKLHYGSPPTNLHLLSPHHNYNRRASDTPAVRRVLSSHNNISRTSSNTSNLNVNDENVLTRTNSSSGSDGNVKLYGSFQQIPRTPSNNHILVADDDDAVKKEILKDLGFIPNRFGKKLVKQTTQ